MLSHTTMNPDEAETLALAALAATLTDERRAQRFLELTGLDAVELRARAGERSLLAATLAFLEAHEPDLVAVAASHWNETGIPDCGAFGTGPVKRPLLITDCDEVLLHMVSHFDAWLGEAHGIRFAFETGNFGEAMTHWGTGELVAEDRVWPLLTDFFRGEMHRQTLVPGAVEALGRIGEMADIVILTNLGDEAHPWRVEQLAQHGIRHEVVCNRGGKGVPAREIIERYGAGATAFVDDLPVHHASVAKHAPRDSPAAHGRRAEACPSRSGGRARSCPDRRLADRFATGYWND